MMENDMRVEARSVPAEAVMPLRERYRQEAGCQIVRDSCLARGFAEAYEITIEGRVAGYGAVRRMHDPGMLVEFHAEPESRSLALPMIRALIAASGATTMEAQTNMPLMHELLVACASEIRVTSQLFEDAGTTQLDGGNAQFRAATPRDAGRIFAHHREPVGPYVIEVEGRIVATGGFLGHYNPPYVDLFMEVNAPDRGQGYGSFLLQELKAVCRELGKVPAARCDPDNLASQKTLLKAGFRVCGELQWGEIRPGNA